MPWLRDGNDRTLATVIERWTEKVRSQMAEIHVWRDDPRELERGYNPRTRSHILYMDTAYLVSEITAHFPNLDPTPIQRIYEAARMWNSDGNAERLPNKTVMNELLESALMVTNAVTHRVISRTVATDPDAPGSIVNCDPSKPSITLDGTCYTLPSVDLAEFLRDLIAAGGEYLSATAYGVRSQRHIDKLPKPVLARIERKRNVGCRCQQSPLRGSKAK